MRLWHYSLIPVLPNKMLVSQWRECVAIKRQWENGTLTHRLVNYIVDYPKSYFLWYVNQVCTALLDRGINYNTKLFLEIENYCKDHTPFTYTIDNYPEHNEEYLKQCYYNLQEKYNRGIISETEWQKIDNIKVV